MRRLLLGVFESDEHGAQLAVETHHLLPEPGDVAPGGEVGGVPQPAGLALDAPSQAGVEPGAGRHDVGEGGGPHDPFEARRHGPVHGVERLAPHRLAGHGRPLPLGYPD
jgi:hypothetical protein